MKDLQLFGAAVLVYIVPGFRKLFSPKPITASSPPPSKVVRKTICARVGYSADLCVWHFCLGLFYFLLVMVKL